MATLGKQKRMASFTCQSLEYLHSPPGLLMCVSQEVCVIHYQIYFNERKPDHSLKISQIPHTTYMYT